MNLTAEQIEEFNTNGFLILRNFACNDLCDEILKKAQHHLQHKVEPFESEQEYTHSNENKITLRRLRQVYQREPIFKQWMTNEKIRPLLKTLLKETPVLTLAHHNSIMTKMPKESSRTFWHQDRRYWHFENDNLISVWLSLDDEYLNNGLLEFIPGSHKLELEKDQFDDASNFLDHHPKNKLIIQNKTHQELKKGDIVFFHCKTLHHAGKNISNQAKISFVYTARGISNNPLKNTRSDFEEVVLD